MGSREEVRAQCKLFALVDRVMYVSLERKCEQSEVV